jgi:hypothetical protein
MGSVTTGEGARALQMSRVHGVTDVERGRGVSVPGDARRVIVTSMESL